VGINLEVDEGLSGDPGTVGDGSGYEDDITGSEGGDAIQNAKNEVSWFNGKKECSSPEVKARIAKY